MTVITYKYIVIPIYNIYFTYISGMILAVLCFTYTNGVIVNVLCFTYTIVVIVNVLCSVLHT